MRGTVLALSAIVLLAGACTDEYADQSASPSTPIETQTQDNDVAAKAEIYAAVIRRLVMKDHTFGGANSPFQYVYVVNGPVQGAGNPLKYSFEPAPEPFSQQLTDGIEERLKLLPPLKFITDPDDVRRGMGGVKKFGVIISLGPVERKDGKVHISNALWCGGKCGQWLTYVLRKDQGKWKISGTTGPYAIS